MPQVWLTFEEIAEFYHCDGAGARGRAFASQWERRRCSDGEIRVLLPPDAGRAYMVRYLEQLETSDAEPCAPEQVESCEPPPNAEGFEAAMAALRQVFGQVEHPRAEAQAVNALAPVIKLGKARFYRQFSYSQAS